MADERLGRTQFARLDESPDTDFYAMARMVAHIDDPVRAALAAYFADNLPSGGRIFDIMSS